MSTRTHFWIAVTLLLTLVMASVAPGQSAASRLGTYDNNGEAYFALSLTPGVQADPAQKNEIVVLIDTSASQAGRFRSDALTTLGALLGGLKADDRVQLMAVDLNAVPMTDGFVAPGSSAMLAGINKLQGRAPLGATDLGGGLRAAAEKFSTGNVARSVIYVGDANSKANLFTAASLSKLVSDLRNQQVSVSGYVMGQERNGQLLAALANHTGGVALIDNTAAGAAQAAGQTLGAATHAGVIWPTNVSLPENVAASYPVDMPPLRTDRDSILIGKLSKAADMNVEMQGTLNGQPLQVAWKVAPAKPSEDFAFLPKLVDLAASDQGLSLPTVGSPALREAALVTLASAVQLTKLGHEALASGNFAGAEKVAAAALARDPGNPEARALQSAARKASATGKTPEPDLKLTGFVAEQPAGNSLLEEVLAEQPGFLGRVDAERKIVADKVRAEVESSLADARRIMGQNPEQAEQDLKLVLQNIESSTDLEPEVRGQLRQQLENAIRQSRRVAVEVAARKADQEEQAAIGKERERLNSALAVHEQQLKQIMDRFDALMDEGKWQIAESDVAPEVQRLAPNTSLAVSAVDGGGLQRAVHDMFALKYTRERNFLAAMYQVELSFVPFPDEPPIIYMEAERWQDLTRRREKYKAVDLGRRGGSEERIFQELNKPTTLELVETPLRDVVTYISEQHQIPIVLASKKLEEASVSPDTPITKNLKGITLRSALRLMLKELELTYVVREEVLQITTPEDAESQLITKVYPVGDLVVPIGIGGGGLFGLGGMGMGGMGGMGGGMGGMGGGMMGGMGGMGGGMMAVEDELHLGVRKPVPPTQPVASPSLRK